MSTKKAPKTTRGPSPETKEILRRSAAERAAAQEAAGKRGPGVWTGDLSAFGRFLKKHKITRDAIAVGLGITPSYVSMIAHKKARPGFKLAESIARWTKANAPEAFSLDSWA